MSDPEISHRCPACGASIRERAFFCPECGNQLAEPNNEDVAASISEPAEQELPSPAETRTQSLAPESSEQSTSPPRQRPGGSSLNYSGNLSAKAPGGERMGHRTAQRHLEGELGQRVDRIRRISTEVLDQAAYDPSLRFILVAAFLFLLFLVILFLSKFIR